MKRKLHFLFTIVASLIFIGQVDAQVIFRVEAPASLAGNTYDITHTSGWGADMMDPANAITDTVVLVDAGGTADSLGCDTLLNASELAGQIALIYRGGCEFGYKALMAQNAGAIGVIIVNGGPANPGPDDLINMGPGTYGAQVTIPVVNVSINTGAALRPSVDAGTLVVFIGSKVGANVNDVGITKADIVTARSAAYPSYLLPGHDTVRVGSYVFNIGSGNQTDVVLTAVVTLNGVEVYNQSSAATPLLSMDTAFIDLPDFDPTLPGDYVISYTVTTSNGDEETSDNGPVTATFSVTEVTENNRYSKSRLDSAGAPMATAFYRPSGSGMFKHCIVIDEKELNDRISVLGMSFALASTTASGWDLTFNQVLVEILEWNDPDYTTMNDVSTVVASATYEYAANLQKEFVTQNFATPVQLVDDKRYLACVTVDNIDCPDCLMLGYDDKMDYSATIDANQEYYFPLFSTQWYQSGFGGDIVPAITLNTDIFVNVKETAANSKELSAYPNPTNNLLNISLAEAPKGNVNVAVYDIVGKLVKSEVVSTTSKNFTVNTTDMNNGTYIFKLTFEDNTQSSFKVSVNR